MCRASYSHDPWLGRPYVRISSADPQVRWGTAVLERLNLRGNERVLDAGCGSGPVTQLPLELRARTSAAGTTSRASRTPTVGCAPRASPTSRCRPTRGPRFSPPTGLWPTSLETIFLRPLFDWPDERLREVAGEAAGRLPGRELDYARLNMVARRGVRSMPAA